jgi:Ankyrin repeats (many copies)
VSIAYFEHCIFSSFAFGASYMIHLYVAILHKKAGAIHKILDEDPSAVNAPLNEEGMTPLLCALKEGYIDIVRLLLARGAHMAVDHASNHRDFDAALRYFYDKRSLEMTKVMLDHGAQSHLCHACMYDMIDRCLAEGKVKHVLFLLDRGFPIARHRPNYTLLHSAMVMHLDTMDVITGLVERGSQTEATNYVGLMPFMLAATRPFPCLENMAHLLTLGARPLVDLALVERPFRDDVKRMVDRSHLMRRAGLLAMIE